MILNDLRRAAAGADFVLLQWGKTGKIIAGKYLSLSDIRLRTLVFRDGHVYYSNSAGIMQMHNNRAVVVFKDRDVLTTVSGRRKGVNVPAGWTEKGEDAIETRLCFRTELSDGACAKDMEKAEAMFRSAYYDVRGILIPPFFRITRMPETIKPVFTTELIRQIGGKKADSLEALQTKFLAHLEDFGEFTEGGYAIPADLVCRGGMFVVRCCEGDGFGGAVYQLPGKVFRADLINRKWEIETGKGNEDEFTGNLEGIVL